jgi:hypothetical protein
MARYKLEIFETYEMTIEPVLRERRDISAKDDPAAVAEANRRYEELAKALDEAKAAVTLAGFILYDGFRVVCEHRRWTTPLPQRGQIRAMANERDELTDEERRALLDLIYWGNRAQSVPTIRAHSDAGDH